MFPSSDKNSQLFLPLFALLQVSPTYELARLFRSGVNSKKFLSLLPNDFQDVLNTYDKFGSVMDVESSSWVTKAPRRHFDFQYLNSPVQTLGYIGLEEEILSYESLLQELGDIVESRNKTNDDSVYQVIMFKGNVGLPTLVEDFKYHVKKGRRYTLPLDGAEVIQTKAKLSKQRLHDEKIRKGIELLFEKIANPSLQYWKIGERVKFSKTFDKRINNPKLSPFEIKVAKEEYGKIVYRAIKKFERMVENAARGKYPCDDPIEYVKFDYVSIQKRMNSYNEWVRLNPTQWQVHPELPEDATMEDYLARLNAPPLLKPLFEIDTRQKELF